jgi:hypothetical protein
VDGTALKPGFGPCQSDWILPRRAFLAGYYEHEAQGDHQPRRAGASTMLSSNTLFSNRHKVPAWRVPSEASNTPKMGATAGVALPLLAAHRLEGSSTGCLRNQ